MVTNTVARVAPASGEGAVALLTGGIDKPYAFGLATALSSRGTALDVIGSDAIDSPELHASPRLRFLNLRGDQREDAGLAVKAMRILRYYARLVRYAATARPRVFHILWNNRFETFDRTLLMLYFRFLGKRIALTAHNVNAGVRDASDSAFNRLTLKVQYRLADHVFVHTGRMKAELVRSFGLPDSAISVIPLGINNSVPSSALTRIEARARLGFAPADKTILFFGAIGPYKGLAHLVTAFHELATGDAGYRLLVVGKPKAGHEAYWDAILQSLRRHPSLPRVTMRIEFVPDEETELYFKAADVLALPYTDVSQSGVLVLAYRFGLPVVASDAGSLREDVVVGETGFLFEAGNPVSLVRALRGYFGSGLFGDLENRRSGIREYGETRYSWAVVAAETARVYQDLLSTLSVEGRRQVEGGVGSGR